MHQLVLGMRSEEVKYEAKYEISNHATPRVQKGQLFIFFPFQKKLFCTGGIA